MQTEVGWAVTKFRQAENNDYSRRWVRKLLILVEKKLVCLGIDQDLGRDDYTFKNSDFLIGFEFAKGDHGIS